MSAIAPEAIVLCLLLGVLLGLVFTLFEFVRLLFSPGRVLTALFDVLFCLFAALVSFLLALAVAKGNMRFFQAACEIIGFLSVYLSLTYAVRRVLPRLVRRTKRLSKCIAGRVEHVGKIFLRKKRPTKAESEKKRE